MAIKAKHLKETGGSIDLDDYKTMLKLVKGVRNVLMGRMQIYDVRNLVNKED